MLNRGEGYPIVVLMAISLTLSDVEIFSVPLSALGLSSSEKGLFKSLAHF